ncbi:hypothetical protein PANT_27d00017 [Moesziomyces antarcticus T-34]|uniref:Kinesin motor domain-containing protein n=1 Tax=Pseudozyma antarctica (strain T-34) TaxID=1151754 RepID=M9MJ54_PSEA3|nr:hypothetical protein PANT_27d00017 [Moesziomyces antarcticus T-34]
MSPAVTRATAASAQQQQPLTTDDQTSAAASREPFVPKRKPSKPAPYAYLVTEASNSVDSLPIRAPSNKPDGLAATLIVPARPASALETASCTAPFSPAHQQPTRTSHISHPAPARTVRSASRNLAPIATHTVTASAPVSAATTPRLRAEPAFARNPFALEEPASRPRSLTPSLMAGRSAAAQPAAPSTPRIKAAVSADVAARIRSPRKHASVSALRATAASELRQPISSRPALVQSQTQLTRDAESLAEAYAHSSSTWQTSGDTSNDGEHAGDSSFVYDADADTHAEAGGHETVQVHVRLRPPKRGEECAWVANPYSGTVALEASIASGRTQSANLGPFTFDGIQTGSANRPVYISVARPLVRAALDGYDAVVFAYGQTASGKTFTLSGDERGQEAGIIPRAVRDIFRGIQQSSARREYLLRASYLEIWNEVVKDLLEPSNVPQVRDDKRRRGGKGTTVQPLREEIVTMGASAYARPVSPVKRSSAVVASYVFGFDDPPHILAEKLFLANRKIEALSRKLASRPSLPSSSEAQVELVARQQQQIRELEAVCEAQAQDAPPKIREDVEREFAARLAELEHKLEEKDSFIAEIQAESDRLRRANAQLMELAHQQTRDMVENLASPQRKPSPLKTADTNARRRPLDSPTKSRPRPMSLFNPTSSELASAFALDTETKKSTPPAAHNRRSISNDYTLLKLGTQHIEHEIDQRSATIPASETFAALPGQSLAALVKASVEPTIEE